MQCFWHNSQPPERGTENKIIPLHSQLDVVSWCNSLIYCNREESVNLYPLYYSIDIYRKLLNLSKNIALTFVNINLGEMY
jgi:hypothetical protein